MKKLFFFSLFLLGLSETTLAQKPIEPSNKLAAPNKTALPVANSQPAAAPITPPTVALPAGQGPVAPQPALANNEFKRDPFRLPEYLINKLKVKPSNIPQEPARIDDAIDPLQRWPLLNYSLIGIIWDVKNPKALVLDLQKRVHLVRVNDKIANQGGVITAIQEGSITVLQEKVPQVLRLKK